MNKKQTIAMWEKRIQDEKAGEANPTLIQWMKDRLKDAKL